MEVTFKLIQRRRMEERGVQSRQECVCILHVFYFLHFMMFYHLGGLLGKGKDYPSQG